MARLVYLLLLTALLAGGCKKKGGDGGPTIDIETSPPSGSVQAQAPGPDFPLTVTIRSAMPAGGVRIDVAARPEGSTTPFFTATQNTTNAVNNFVITGTPQAIVCIVEVTVTDTQNSAVRGTASYRYSRK